VKVSARQPLGYFPYSVTLAEAGRKRLQRELRPRRTKDVGLGALIDGRRRVRNPVRERSHQVPQRGGRAVLPAVPHRRPPPLLCHVDIPCLI
jgi:hypothetical protein